MEESRPTSNRFKAVIVIILVVILGLSGLLPSYTYVRVSGADGEVEVKNAGRGPQKVKVSKGDVRVESTAW